MINEPLLKKGLRIDEVIEFTRFFHGNKIKKLPTYTISCCPICFKENIEYIDTYSLYWWHSVGKKEPSEEVYHPGGVIFHCEHFVVGQTFAFITKTNNVELNAAHFHFNNLFDFMTGRRNRNFFVPQRPLVLGFILENRVAKAVLHVLPICEYIKGDFVPAHLLYIISYFSEQPEVTHTALEKEAQSRAGEDGFPSLENYMPSGDTKHWFNLPYWVERKMLYWVNPYAIEKNYDPDKCLLTGDVNAFPYKDPRELVKKKAGR